jgi:hypothetical protein
MRLDDRGNVRQADRVDFVQRGGAAGIQGASGPAWRRPSTLEAVVKLLRSLRDRLLKSVLPDIEAGACVPDHGCCCREPFVVAFNCFGACVSASSCFPSKLDRCR